MLKLPPLVVGGVVALALEMGGLIAIASARASTAPIALRRRLIRMVGAPCRRSQGNASQ